MVKPFLALIALWLCLVPAAAQQRVSEAQMRQQINAAASKMTTMQCDFVQTKRVRMLNDKMVSRGRMYCQQPGKLRWEYTSPYAYTFVLNGAKALVDAGGRRDVVSVSQSKLFREIARVMMGTLAGKSLSDSKNFTTTLASTTTEYVATLVPKQKAMRQMFARIVLHFNRRTAAVEKVEMHEPKGDTTVIELKNVKTNTAINAKVFDID